MKKKLVFLRETFFLAVVIILCTLIIAVSKGYHPSLFGYQVLRVLTQSMVPALEEDTLILIKKVPQEEIRENDIITFVSKDPTLLGYYNTHRVVRIEKNPDTGEISYITKGDINTLEDLYPVSYEDIAGKLVCVLPFGNWIGRGMTKLANKRTYFFIVMLPLLLCLISYIWQIFHILVLEEENPPQEEKQDVEQSAEQKIKQYDEKK